MLSLKYFSEIGHYFSIGFDRYPQNMQESNLMTRAKSIYRDLVRQQNYPAPLTTGIYIESAHSYEDDGGMFIYEQPQLYTMTSFKFSSVRVNF